MDLETENRLASLLLEDARRLQQQADKEGVHAYLRKPNVRHRPNSRFLAATVLGVEQANRVVEVNEMWRARQKELELESKMKNSSSGRMRSTSERRHDDSADQSLHSNIERKRSYATSSSTRDSASSSCSDRENGLGDDEIEEFLRSRVKRGRGAVGSRMDEPGPYLTAPEPADRQHLSTTADVRVDDDLKRRVLAPDKPLFLRTKSSDDEPSTSSRHRKEKKRDRDPERKKKKKKSSKHHSHRYRSRSRE